MLKLPVWLLEQIAKGAKTVNPSDALTQTNIDDLAKLVHAILGW